MEFDEMTWKEVEFIINKIATHGVTVYDEETLSNLSVIMIDGDGFIEISAPKDLEAIHLAGTTWFGGGVGLCIGRHPYTDERSPKKYLISEVPRDMKDHLFEVVLMGML